MTKLLQAMHTLAEEFRSAVELIAERDGEPLDAGRSPPAKGDASPPNEEGSSSYIWQSPWS
ncbi:MAG: hypothetical protein V4558_09745 [Gemmatimonadota bacterium]